MKLVNIHDIGGGKALPSVIDVFVGSVSYENRCLSVARWLAKSTVKAAIIAENMNHEELHRGNGERLRGFFPNCFPVDLDTADPLKTADSLRAALDQFDLDASSVVVVDITTFTHEALLIFFGLIRVRFSRLKPIYAYATAEEYSIGLPPAEKWLSRGVEDVRSVLGYPGIFRPSRKLHLIALVGFEDERVGELVSQYEPSEISLGYGDKDPGREARHRRRALLGYQRLRSVYDDSRQFTFACFDPIATRDALCQVVATHPKHNVVIAALNTKLSTLGAALVALEDVDVQLCYAQAILYNVRGYSSPGNELYLFAVG